MKNKKDDYFELTTMQIIAKWIIRQNWLQIVLIGLSVMVVIAALLAFAYLIVNSCDDQCKVERYRVCRIEHPDIGEYGCLLFVIDD